MPTYRCTVPSGMLDASQKARVAKEITRIHHTVTGAATFFAQVMFDEVEEGNYFVGGVPLRHGQIFVHGTIRAGRSAVDLQRLIAEMVPAVAEAAGSQRRQVWIYLSELPARRMAEYGHVLPEPGDESVWLDNLPSEDREMLLKLGD